MRLITLLLLGLLTVAQAQALTLSITQTTPANNNLAACGQPPSLTPAADSVMVRWQVAGPSLAVADSLKTVRGATFTKSYTVPGGGYTVTSVVARKSLSSGLWILSCPLTKVFMVNDTAAPDTVILTCPQCP